MFFFKGSLLCSPQRGWAVGIMVGALALTGTWWRAVAGQNPPAPVPSEKPVVPSKTMPPGAPETAKRGRITGVGWKHNAQTETGAVRDFTYAEDELTVAGQSARYDDKKKILLAEGSLVLQDKKHHVTADKADVNYSKKKQLAILTGNVVITLKPQTERPSPPGAPSPANTKTEAAPPNGSLQPAPITPPPTQEESQANVQSERKRGVVITCDRVEDHYKKEFITLRGNLVFKQKITRKKDGKTVERTLTADYAEYDGKVNKLVLYPPVKGSDTEGQEVSFEDKVTVGTKEGEETLESDGKTVLFLNTEEAGEDEADTEKKPEDKNPTNKKPEGDKKPEDGKKPEETNRSQ